MMTVTKWEKTSESKSKLLNSNPLVVVKTVEFKPLIVGNRYNKNQIEDYFRGLIREGKTQVAFKFSENDVKTYLFNLESVYNTFHTEWKNHSYAIKTVGWASRKEGVINLDIEYR